LRKRGDLQPHRQAERDDALIHRAKDHPESARGRKVSGVLAGDSVAGWNGNIGVVESVSKGFGRGIHGRLADSESTDRD